MKLVWIVMTGVAFGLGAVLLVVFGNPGNYGFCAACQLRDIAGALGLHHVETLQYVRPEILGWICGAFVVAAWSGKGLRPRGGSRPILRLLLGMIMMIGALAFLGCPLRATLRLAGGDLNGITGLAGFIAGIAVGIVFLKRGFNLGRARFYEGKLKFVGYIPLIVAGVLFMAAAMHAPFLSSSVKGPGSMHAPILVSTLAGLITGMLAWRTRMCLSGGFRDFLLVRDTYLLKVYGCLFVAALVANVYFGLFKLGFDQQPLAHTMHVWNFLGLFVTGIAATLSGGCPLRQLIMSGEGNSDAMFCVLGMVMGAGVAHGLNAAGSAAGVTLHGQIAVLLSLVIVLILGWQCREKLTT